MNRLHGRYSSTHVRPTYCHRQEPWYPTNYIGETWRRAIAKSVLHVAGRKPKSPVGLSFVLAWNQDRRRHSRCAALVSYTAEEEWDFAH
jgi:hypothetical protein